MLSDRRGIGNLFPLVLKGGIKKMKISKLAEILEIEYRGDDFNAKRINTIKEASREEITFLENEKFIKELKHSKAGAVFIKKELLSYLPANCTALITDNPYLSMAYASEFFAKKIVQTEGKDAVIGKNCTIAKNVYLGKNSKIADNVTILSGVYVGDNVTIEEGSVIYPNVTIYNDTVIGKRCFIQAGAVLGSDGFGYAHTDDGKHIKIYHSGNVVLEDDVEVGANSTIDRAVFGTTLIKSGTKIDNLVQIAHNCELDQNCIIVAQAGISGSSKLGRNVIMGGQSATAGHLQIGDFATIAARGGVTKSLEGKKTYGGFPIMIHKDWLKLQAKISKFFKGKK